MRKDIKIFQGKYLILPDKDLKVNILNEEVFVMVAKTFPFFLTL